MPCYFRIFGEMLNVDSLLSQVKLAPDRIWRKGERRFPNNSKSEVFTHSGFSLLASEADASEFERQIEDVTDFLIQHEADVATMVTFRGVEAAILDFSIEFRSVAIHSDYLPPAFLSLVGKAGIGVELSHYPAPEESNREDVSPQAH